MTSPDNATEFCRRLSEAVTVGTDAVEGVLKDLLLHADGRAVGLWRVAGDRLVCLGFAACDDMPEDVEREFRELTASVPLERIDLGIVQATVSREPTIAQRVSPDGRLAGSASWLVRFESESSLSAPFPPDGPPEGVLAVSSREQFDLDTGAGPLLLAIASTLQLPA